MQGFAGSQTVCQRPERSEAFIFGVNAGPITPSSLYTWLKVRHLYRWCTYVMHRSRCLFDKGLGSGGGRPPPMLSVFAVLKF